MCLYPVLYSSLGKRVVRSVLSFRAMMYGKFKRKLQSSNMTREKKYSAVSVEE